MYELSLKPIDWPFHMSIILISVTFLWHISHLHFKWVLSHVKLTGRRVSRWLEEPWKSRRWNILPQEIPLVVSWQSNPDRLDEPYPLSDSLKKREKKIKKKTTGSLEMDILDGWSNIGPRHQRNGSISALPSKTSQLEVGSIGWYLNQFKPLEEHSQKDVL